MYSDKQRGIAILNSAISEMELLQKMSEAITVPGDFMSNLTGMTVFRACGMSLQYITESFVKIRNLFGMAFLEKYKTITWKSVFGMRNFLSHEYVDVDEEAVFSTIKNDIPMLLETTRTILAELEASDEE